MQVHAVPESDRYTDDSGRKLPWGYDRDPTAGSLENREPIEKGPFGRSQRRSRSGLSRSRSKTAEPRREEDRVKAEQLAAEDAVFGSLRKTAKEDGGRREALGEMDANSVAQPSSRSHGDFEATEALLYGFGDELQWAAIDHYERVSNGNILEDYDRQPPGQRYDVARSLSRATSQRSLSRAALKKKNTFAGGLHWIKVTFDSRGAAELACARSPHIIKGHLVYAEPYLGRGPGKDEPIFASQAGAQITDPVLPPSFSTHTMNASPNGSSTTATSATATGRRASSRDNGDSQASTSTSGTLPMPNSSQPSQSGLQTTSTSVSGRAPSTPGGQVTLRRSRIEGATPATLLPASAAILPKAPKQSWSTWLGTGEVIGSTVPKKEDGSFDYEKASMYWKVMWFLDTWFGTDACGLRAE